MVFLMPGLSESLTVIGDLVNAGEGPAALLQVVVARVDVGALGERGVVVACPLADDGDEQTRTRQTNWLAAPDGSPLGGCIPLTGLPEDRGAVLGLLHASCLPKAVRSSRA